MPIQIVCAWCKKPMGEKPGDAVLPETHSICPECAEKLQAEMDSNQPINQKEDDK